MTQVFCPGFRMQWAFHEDMVDGVEWVATWALVWVVHLGPVSEGVLACEGMFRHVPNGCGGEVAGLVSEGSGLTPSENLLWNFPGLSVGYR